MVSIPLELKHHLDSFCLAEESMRPLLLSMVAALRREMNVFLKTFVEVFGLLLILHPLILGASGLRSEGTSSATPHDSAGPRTGMESWLWT